jgi:hypothetical protein
MTDTRTRSAVELDTRIAINPEMAWQLDYLFDNQVGQLCLGYVDGDPSISKGDPNYAPMRSTYFDWPQERPTALRWLAWHDTQDRNTYVRMCLFAPGKSTTKKNALPSRIIWRDDVKDPMAPCSLLLETSEGNHQAIIKLDRPATTAERQRLMTAWRNGHDDSCVCSADPIHFIRIAGGHNTKRGGSYRVHFAQQTTRIYPADRLLARCGPVRGETHSPVAPAGLDQAALDYWQAHVEQLLTADRTLPRAFVHDTPGRRILELRAAGKGMLFHASGTWDASRERLWLANSLVLARYLDEQIATLLWHFEVSATIEIKGAAAIWADIAQVIGRARAAHPHITPRLYGARPEQPRKAPRGRAGKHSDLVERVYTLLQDYRAGAQAIVKAQEIASALGVHRRTIVTILDELRTASRIATRRLAGGAGLLIEFLSKRDVIYSAAPAAELPTPAPEIAPAATALGETEERECVSPYMAPNDHSSETPVVAPEYAPPAAWSLADLLVEQLDSLPRQRPNERTGELKRWPVTDRRVLAALAEQYPDAWPVWRRSAPGVLRGIRRGRRNAQFEAIRSLDDRALDSKIGSLSKTIRRYEQRRDTADCPLIAQSWQVEIDRRQGFLKLHAEERAKRDAREARAVERWGYSLLEQAEMLDLIARLDTRSRPGRATIDRQVRDLDDDDLARAARDAPALDRRWESMTDEERLGQCARNELAKRQDRARQQAAKDAEQAKHAAVHDAKGEAQIAQFKQQARAAFPGTAQQFEAQWPQILADWQRGQALAGENRALAEKRAMMRDLL